MVGMHGAAISFMVFLPPGARAVEVSIGSPKMFKKYARCSPWVKHVIVEQGNRGRNDHSRPQQHKVDVGKVIAALQNRASNSRG